MKIKRDKCRRSGRMTVRGCISILLSILLFPALVLGAPGIDGVSGTIANGQSITIIGSGFGSKSPAAPVLWAPFDSNANPSTLGRITSWSRAHGCQEWNASAGAVGGGVRLLSSCDANTTAGYEANTSSIGYSFNAHNQKNYIFRKRKIDYNPANYTNSILKSMEFIGTDYSTNNAVIVTYMGGSSGSTLIVGQLCSPDPPQWTGCYAPWPGGIGSWRSEELIVQAGASDGALAYIKYYTNGTLLNDSEDGCLTAVRSAVADERTEIYRFAPLFHGDYNIEGAGTMANTPESFDDIYIDSTWSRVMLGNASTWAASTQREIMPPTAWSANSITVSFNVGAFTAGQTAYLYVFDDTNTPNSVGYAVTIGGGVSITPPAAPSGLTVN